MRFGDDGEFWHLIVLVVASLATWLGMYLIINALL